MLAIFVSFLAISPAHLTCWSKSMVGYFSSNWISGACFMIMYSLPIGFEASSFQSSIFGIGISVSACTMKTKGG